MSDLEKDLARFQELSKEVNLEENIKDQRKFRVLIEEYNRLGSYVPLYEQYVQKGEEIADYQKQIASPETESEEWRKTLRQEVEQLKVEREALRIKIQRKLIEEEENYPKLIMEIRAGTGGEEACLFASDLYRMYTRYAENNKWKVEVIDTSLSTTGGVKEASMNIEGKDAWKLLKNEMGTHRVQRIPETESSGRIHTSAATVAILPFIEEEQLSIHENELRIDTYRASGAGGQHVNTTDSAIRITHLETGIVVTCQDERSQLKNKEKAMKLLRAKLFQFQREQKLNEEQEQRRQQVGTGDRSGRVRTYNFPQGRVTDHRIGLTLFNLENFINGQIEKMTEALAENEIESKLKSSSV